MWTKCAGAASVIALAILWSLLALTWLAPGAGARNGLVLAGGPLAGTATPTPASESLPPGAVIQTVVGPFEAANAMAFDPGGRIFYTEKAGAVRLIVNGVIQATPVITFDVDTCSERGLLGIALDPQFGSNHYVYVYYSANSGCGATTNNVARFVENNGVGSNPQIIFSSPQTAGNHNGGNIHFGPDGKLYISIGDNANAANAQDVTVKNGKMHRINPDGSIPPDNPVFTQTGALPSLFAFGLRNSFDFTFDSLNPGRIFASENGPSCDDEMNRIVGGYNYGWRDPYPCDDDNPDPTYNTIPPLWYVPNGACCVAPTGIEVYRGSSVAQWTDGLFMCQYNTGQLIHFYLDATRTQVLAAPVVNGVTCNMDIATGTDGAFYYFEGGGYSNTTLKRIVGTGPTVTPTHPAASPTPRPPTQTPGGPTATPAPCTISFSDVHPTDYFYGPVAYLYCHGAIAGYADGTFRPYANTTRAQMVKIVVLALGFPVQIPSRPTFSDVPADFPFYPYIETAVAHNLVGGYADGTFRPYANVTRGQLSKIDVSAAGWTLQNPATATFNDVPPGSAFYTFVETAACHGVVSGYGDGTFRPGANAIRGQIAKIVYLSLGAPQATCGATSVRSP